MRPLLLVFCLTCSGYASAEKVVPQGKSVWAEREAYCAAETPVTRCSKSQQCYAATYIRLFVKGSKVCGDINSGGTGGQHCPSLKTPGSKLMGEVKGNKIVLKFSSSFAAGDDEGVAVLSVADNRLHWKTIKQLSSVGAWETIGLTRKSLGQIDARVLNEVCLPYFSTGQLRPLGNY